MKTTPKYNYADIQQLIDSGNSYRSLKQLLGISSRTLWKAQQEGLIKFPAKNQQRLLELGINKSHKHTAETKEKLSILMTERIQKNIRYSTMENYNGVWLDSTYESILARELDANKIEWTRPKSLKWNDDGTIRRYIPDFYLPAYNVYLDPKNDFLIVKDDRKIKLASEYNLVRIIILTKDELTWPAVLEKINR